MHYGNIERQTDTRMRTYTQMGYLFGMHQKYTHVQNLCVDLFKPNCRWHTVPLVDSKYAWLEYPKRATIFDNFMLYHLYS